MSNEARRRLVTAITAMYAFYDREVSEVHLQVWLDDMAGFPVEAVERAMVAHRRDPQRGQWLAKPADILRHLQTDQGDRAQLAWAQTLECARNGGAGSQALEDAARKALDAIGGMRALRMANETQVGHMQRQFLAAFGAYVNRANVEATLLGNDAKDMGKLLAIVEKGLTRPPFYESSEAQA